MENAADALKMAFAIFVFILALVIVFSMIGRIKDTADEILFYSDETNYYDWVSGDLSERKNSRSRSSSSSIIQ